MLLRNAHLILFTALIVTLTKAPFLFAQKKQVGLKKMPNISIKFVVEDKEQKNVAELSFEGAQYKVLTTRDVDGAIDPQALKCTGSGTFKVVNLKVKTIEAYLTLVCGESDQKEVSKISRLYIPVNNYTNFEKKIYIHGSKPLLTLKVKELNL